MQDYDRQQRTANMLAAGNLWYQRQSAVAMNKMAEVQKEIMNTLEPLT